MDGTAAAAVEAGVDAGKETAITNDATKPDAEAGVDVVKEIAHGPVRPLPNTARTPWSKTAAAEDGGKKGDLVMGAESWPALGDVWTKGSPNRAAAKPIVDNLLLYPLQTTSNQCCGPPPPPPSPMYSLSGPRPEMLQVPCFDPQAPHDSNRTADMKALEANLVKQIEYYFRLVTKMTSDESLILDALRSSHLIEVQVTLIPLYFLETFCPHSYLNWQGNQIRNRNDWSKWVSASCQPLVSTRSESLGNQPPVRVEDSDNNETNVICISHENSSASSNPTEYCSEAKINNCSECSTDNLLTSDGTIIHNGDVMSNSKKVESGKFSEDGQRDSCGGCNCTPVNDSIGTYVDVRTNFGDSGISKMSVEEAKLSISDAKVEKIANPTSMRSGIQASDFGNGFLDESLSLNTQSTFMLDEELELEQTTNAPEHLSLNNR
ncbi:hypothetical protein BHM03_00026156 [Ensete ventricosum]|nr:hypothetical protein BHM03_00026156 [Ensete ventricosum]